MMFGLKQEDFDNLKKLTELPDEDQAKIIDEAIEIAKKLEILNSIA